MKIVLLLAFLLTGCMLPYSRPEVAADFAAMGLRPPESAEEIAVAGARRPAANLPATLAAFHVQAYVANDRALEYPDDVNHLASMRGIGSVVPLSGVVPRGQDFGLDCLRSAGARVHADLVLVYTFETDTTPDTTIPLLGTFTLGIFPNEITRATSTGSAALIDARTGYLYGLTQATSKQYRITNAWNVRAVREKSADDARNRACKDLVAQVEELWEGVLARYCAGLQ